MKTIKFKTALLFSLMMVMCIPITSQLKAHSKNDSANIPPVESDSLSKAIQEYQKMFEEAMEKQEEFPEEISNPLHAENKMFGISLDLIGGFSSTSADIERSINVAGNIPATTNNGPFAGANVSLNLFGFDFTTGLSYSSKGFKTSNDDKFDLNYFNIPFLISFNFNAGKIDIEPSLGPYLGIMFSNNDSLVSSTDLGAIGSVQGTYMFQKHLGALLGSKYEMGGLMNFGNNENVTPIKTRSWCFTQE